MSAVKALLETVRVARHVALLAARPVRHATVQAAKASEEFALAAMKSQPAQDVLGRHRAKQVTDMYVQVRQIASESAGSLTYESVAWACQSGAQGLTSAFKATGVNLRVVGPFDPHWDAQKLIKELQVASDERAQSGFQLTPRRFVQFMREAERKKATRSRDPIEAYVENMIKTGRLSAGGVTMVLEKKLYTDIARIVCFAFDRALQSANEFEMWGHRLHVKSSIRRSGDESMVHRFDDGDSRAAMPSAVSTKLVEAMVDQMLTSQDLEASLLFSNVQRQLLVNCSVMILQLLEDMTSSRSMQVSLLGHSLNVIFEPLPPNKILDGLGHALKDGREGSAGVNTRAIEELVQAILDDSEVQFVFMPDIVEGEIYRFALTRGICIAQEVLSHLKLKLFGIEVHLDLVPDEQGGQRAAGVASAEYGDLDGRGEHGSWTLVPVTDEVVEKCLSRIEGERRRIERELALRRQEVTGEDLAPVPRVSAEAGYERPVHEFEQLAAQDRLSRCLSIQRTVNVPLDVAYELVSDFDAYPTWMPFCTSAKVLSREAKSIRCEVGFGLESVPLGSLGDQVRYRVVLWPPGEQGQRGAFPTAREDAVRTARVVANSEAGFSYGKQLVYDWRFIETQKGFTDVRVDMFFQAHNKFMLPVWDSIQAGVNGQMMRKFVTRASVVMRQRGVTALPGIAAVASSSPETTSPAPTPPRDEGGPPRQAPVVPQGL